MNVESHIEVFVDKEESLPLPNVVHIKRMRSCSWVIGADIPESTLVWNPLETVQNTDLCQFTNLYAIQNNRPGYANLEIFILSGCSQCPGINHVLKIF